MGGISSRLTRQFYRYNAENRAHKIISRKEVRPAPKYENIRKQIDMMEKEMPALKEDLSKFDPNLHDRLKKVYVTASDVTPAQKVFTKPPPLSHEVRRTADFGFDESETARPGHISLRDALQMIISHTKDDNSKIEDLAEAYKIKVEDARNITKHFQCFTLRYPTGTFPTAKFLNTIMIGNAKGEILTSGQFIKRVQDEKGVRQGLTSHMPPLNKDIEAWDLEEQKKRAIASKSGQKSSDTKQIKSEDKE